MEQVLSVLHGINEKTSFEVWSRKGEMFFAFHTKRKKLIKDLLEMHYPGVFIESKPDILQSDMEFLSCDLKLNENAIFPIRRYSQTADHFNRGWVNPFNTILPVMQQIRKDELLGLQVIFAPGTTTWYQRANDILQIHQFLSSLWLFERCLQSKNFFIFLCDNLWLLRIIMVIISRKSPRFLREDQIDHRNHNRESIYSAAQSKLSQLTFVVNIRLLHSKNQDSPKILHNLAGCFTQFNLPDFNSFTAGNAKTLSGRNTRNRKLYRKNVVLSVEELAGILSLPSAKETEEIRHLQKSRFRVLQGDFKCKNGIHIGNTLNDKPVRIEGRNTAIIGRSGSGKSTAALNMIYNFIQRNEGFAVVDPHGELIEAVAGIIPLDKHCILIDPADEEFPIAFNVLHSSRELAAQVVSGVGDTLSRIFSDSWGRRTDYFLRHALYCLCIAQKSILGIPQLFLNAAFRKQCIAQLSDPIAIAFWKNEYRTMSPKARRDAIDPILNKVGRFMQVPALRNILGQKENRIDFQDIMNSNKILLINLSKGLLGEDNAALLGSFFISRLQIAALERTKIKHKNRMPFHLVVDEVQNFKASIQSLATILSEGRKFKVQLTAIFQHLSQLNPILVDSILANAINLISYNVNHKDAQVLSPYFREITHDDLINLPPYHAYLRMIYEKHNNVCTFRNISIPQHKYKTKSTTRKYSRPRKEVEKEISKFFRNTFPIP
ncbi:type IV secretory system conjugative DNA transfer family protein [Candidatus Uabimicrobium amorphum]|nr:type IV secretion system DNA-binding domain-containing protein [Candidatus Uabimicrobium amorphum]